MGEEAKDTPIPELKWVKRSGSDEPSGASLLPQWWNSVPMEARRELLDDTGVVDISTDDLLELADAFDALVACRWHELPAVFREAIEKCVVVEKQEDPIK